MKLFKRWRIVDSRDNVGEVEETVWGLKVLGGNYDV